ncbi:MAG: chorismate mutase [Rickettsiales bacterium]|nr:chorismate mutase [Rickettsiales bacterium]
MLDSKDKLGQLRQEIDDIDQTITDLLVKRMGIVRQVGHYKKATNSSPSFIRSAREALMVIDLIDKTKGDYDPHAIFNIWRNIIASSLSVEQGLEILVLSENQKRHTGYWLSREYFGNFNPISLVDSVEAILDRLKTAQGVVATLPYPSDASSWWLSWFHNSMPKVKIFSLLPYIQFPNISEKYLAVASLEPEKSGNDASLIAVKLTNTIIPEALKSVEAEIVSTLEQSDATYVLFEVDEYVREGDAIYDHYNQHADQVRIIGSYAKQLNYNHKE